MVKRINNKPAEIFLNGLRALGYCEHENPDDKYFMCKHRINDDNVETTFYNYFWTIDINGITFNYAACPEGCGRYRTWE